ncbi:hypothetical protein V5G24_09995 [Xanthobacter sp. VTT E-85241]|uniref:hypothetical protein n=1 Tax=Roseixanthobacter finlandensis TaxID=3119922 RepID=UPI003726C24F
MIKERINLPGGYYFTRGHSCYELYSADGTYVTDDFSLTEAEDFAAAMNSMLSSAEVALENEQLRKDNSRLCAAVDKLVAKLNEVYSKASSRP